MNALLGYLDLAIPIFCFLAGDAKTLTDVWSRVSLTNFKCSVHPTGPMLAFYLKFEFTLPNFGEALASPAYMVATGNESQ